MDRFGLQAAGRLSRLRQLPPRKLRILAGGRGGGDGFSFELAGLKTSSATVVARTATEEK
jgi:hypothetical protein